MRSGQRQQLASCCRRWHCRLHRRPSRPRRRGRKATTSCAIRTSARPTSTRVGRSTKPSTTCASVPRVAYRHARGETVKHPGGYDVRLKVPLDFLAVSDHSEYLGVLLRMYDPDDPLSRHPLAQEVTSSGDRRDESHEGVLQARLPDDPARRERQGGSGAGGPGAEAHDLGSVHPDYRQLQRAGQVHDAGRVRVDVAPGRANLHRNVIFRSTTTPRRPTPRSTRRAPKTSGSGWRQRANGNRVALDPPQRERLLDGTMYERTKVERPADRQGVGRTSRAQRAPDRDYPGEGARQKPIPCSRPKRRARRLRTVDQAGRGPGHGQGRGHQLRPQCVRQWHGHRAETRRQSVQVRRGRRWRHSPGHRLSRGIRVHR